jgi:hypothetical protein
MPPKIGVDDFLASGGTVAELKLLARPFDPSDFTTLRMSRDDRLRAGVEDLRRKHRGHKRRTTGDYTNRSLERVLIRAAEKRGKPVKDGIRVVISKRTLALEAAISTRGVTRGIPRLEASGFLRRDNVGRKPDQAGAFILLTSEATGAQRCPHNGKGPSPQKQREEKTLSVVPSNRGGDTSARPPEKVPELRWSTVLSYRERDKRGRWERKYEYLARPGKKRAAVVEYLLECGGLSTVAELMERFAGPKTRPRDFKRRTLAMLAEDPAIIVIEGDVVSLGGSWQESLEHVREIGGEIDRLEAGELVKGADTLQRERYRRQSEAFRRRHERSPDRTPKMRPIPDLRTPWPAHPDGCACPKCEERMGRVIGEHVAGCCCASCFTAIKAKADKSERVDLHAAPLAVRQAEPATVVPMYKPTEPVEENPPDDWRDHPLSCECQRCTAPEPSYATPWRAS